MKMKMKMKNQFHIVKKVGKQYCRKKEYKEEGAFVETKNTKRQKKKQ